MPKFIALSLLVFLFIACDSNPVKVHTIDCGTLFANDTVPEHKDYLTPTKDQYQVVDGQCQQVP